MATPDPGASRIKFFSGDPETCLNLSSPDFFVSSTKITGAPSTNPPAVIGRCFSSITGAKTPPVEAPPDCGGHWGLGAAGCLVCCGLANAMEFSVTLNSNARVARTKVTMDLVLLRLAIVFQGFGLP